MKKTIFILILLACSILAATTIQNFVTSGSSLYAQFEGLQTNPIEYQDTNMEEDTFASGSFITKHLPFHMLMQN